MRVAIVGCSHGELDSIYRTIEYINSKEDNSIDLLLCCGDFQSIRNTKDLECLACPSKYKRLGDFHRYYSGEKTAPVFTIFIGGNHEASNFLNDLRYGGFVAPNIFYLGAAGVINFGGIRIAGISGIYKHHDYSYGHFETFPFDESTLRSVYHIRDYEIFQLSHLKQHIDIFLSHDWPRGVENHGNLQQLLIKKPYFREEIETGKFGNPATAMLLHKLQPSFWFSGHLHVKYAAIVKHSTGATASNVTGKANNEATAMITPTTKFLALDKCMVNKDFLQVIEIDCPTTSDPCLTVDAEWLAILRASHHLASSKKIKAPLPSTELEVQPSDIEWVRKKLKSVDDEKTKKEQWPLAFYKSSVTEGIHSAGNPQTDALLELLELPHILTKPHLPARLAQLEAEEDPNEIEIDDM